MQQLNVDLYRLLGEKEALLAGMSARVLELETALMACSAPKLDPKDADPEGDTAGAVEVS